MKDKLRTIIKTLIVESTFSLQRWGGPFKIAATREENTFVFLKIAASMPGGIRPVSWGHSPRIRKYYRNYERLTGRYGHGRKGFFLFDRGSRIWVLLFRVLTPDCGSGMDHRLESHHEDAFVLVLQHRWDGDREEGDLTAREQIK